MEVAARCRDLVTRRGTIRWPAFVPVTTLKGSFPLDELILPYLPRFSQCALVSMYYLKKCGAVDVGMPLMLDSGGFALLREGSRAERDGELGTLVSMEDDGSEVRTTPQGVLELQESIAEIGFTLDFPVPPGTERQAAEDRMSMTLANAAWAVANRRRRDLFLFGGLVGDTVDDYSRMAREMVKLGVEGLAIGGMVPRSGNWGGVEEIVDAVIRESGALPVHVFGIGQAERIRALFKLGVTSCDSSSYVRAAADGQVWGMKAVEEADVATRLHAALANLAMASGRAPLGLMQTTRWLELAGREK